jgi:hypothetical protein
MTLTKRQFTTGVVDINGKFDVSVTSISEHLGKGVNTSVVDTGGKLTTGVKDGGGCSP